jgi:hypothetical protein
LVLWWWPWASAFQSDALGPVLDHVGPSRSIEVPGSRGLVQDVGHLARGLTGPGWQISHQLVATA